METTCTHLARRAQLIEARLQSVELRVRRGFVHRRHRRSASTVIIATACRPVHDNVLIARGCSGHLFKHGPVFSDFVAGVGLREWGTAERFRFGPQQRLSLEESPSGR